MSRALPAPSTRLLQFFALGSALSTYILILIGGYVTTSGSGLGCGDSWPLCSGSVFPNLNDPAQVIEFSHRLFNIVVAFFVLGTLLLAWTRYRRTGTLVLFSTIGSFGLLAQVVLGMFTVTTSLNPIVSAAHLALATAVFAVLVVNAVLARIIGHKLIEVVP